MHRSCHIPDPSPTKHVAEGGRRVGSTEGNVTQPTWSLAQSTLARPE